MKIIYMENPIQPPFSHTYFHDAKADLKIGNFIEVGYNLDTPKGS